MATQVCSASTPLSPAGPQNTPGAAGNSGDAIKVILRVRPLNNRELGHGSSACVFASSHTNIIVKTTGEAHNFAFDVVADEHASQEHVYKAAGRQVVANFLNGINGCIFAYGQTGSGKTHTILGSTEGGSADEGRGLTQRVFEHVFMGISEERRLLEAQGGSCRHVMQCSLLEIYDEKISDLLRPASNLPIREDARKGTFVAGLSAEEVHSVEDVVGLLRRGIASRRVAETRMNDRSSRSHCVFTCTLQCKITDPAGSTRMRTSRLHMVDLAGSERQKDTGAQGRQLREAININASLSALGRVITSLAARQRHVPFRDSKLTQLLQDSLGGNSKTVLVANISPATLHYAETLSTLRFADKAKRIKTKALVNEDVLGGTALARLEIKRLQEQLAHSQQESEAANALASAMEERVVSLQSQVEELDSEVTSLRWQMGTWRQAAEIERELGETRIKQSATALQASHEQMLHSQAELTTDGVLELLARNQQLLQEKAAAEREREALRRELSCVKQELDWERLEKEEALDHLESLGEYAYALEQAKESLEQELLSTQEAQARQADEQEAALLAAAESLVASGGGSCWLEGDPGSPASPAAEGSVRGMGSSPPTPPLRDVAGTASADAAAKVASPITPALRDALGKEQASNRPPYRQRAA